LKGLKVLTFDKRVTYWAHMQRGVFDEKKRGRAIERNKKEVAQLIR